jgi:hypothetical protein
MKQAAKTCVFLILLMTAFWYTDNVMRTKMEGYTILFKEFYKLPRNTLDVVFIGSSRIHCDVNPALIWRERGILAFDLSHSVQPFWQSYFSMIECLKYQRPRVIALEMGAAFFNWEYNDLPRDFHYTHGLRLSKNKINAIVESRPDNRLNLFFRFPVYHGRRNLTRADFVDPYKNRPYPNGYGSIYHTTEFGKPELGAVTEALPLPGKQMTYLAKIINLAKEENITLLFIVSPFVIEEYQQKYFNTARAIAREQGIAFIDYNTLYDELNLDFKTDWADGTHLNVRGAAKFSRHLAKVLAEDYGIPDHRRDPAYAGWNTWAEQVMAGIEAAAY